MITVLIGLKQKKSLIKLLTFVKSIFAVNNSANNNPL